MRSASSSQTSSSRMGEAGFAMVVLIDPQAQFCAREPRAKTNSLKSGCTRTPRTQHSRPSGRSRRAPFVKLLAAPWGMLPERMTNTAIRPVRILGLDPGLRRSGGGMVAVSGARVAHIAHGVIAPKESLPFAERLLVLFEGIAEVIAAHAPDEAAREGTFFKNNAPSPLKLGHARACCLIAPARAGLVVAEYAATVVKKAVVG